MDFFLSLLIPALVGLCVGIFSGMLGVGGGTILVPVFRLFFGMSPISAVATSLFTIIPTSLTGAISHIRQKTLHISLGVILGVSGAFFSPLGVWLASISPPWMVILAVSVIIIYSGVSMFKKALQLKPHKEKQARHTEKEEGAKVETEIYDPFSSKKLNRTQYLIAILSGFIAGFASGYVGVGGGFIMVPLMVIFLGVPMKKASGTSLIAVSTLAIPGVIEHAMLGNIDFVAGLMVALGSMPGAIVGARLLRIIPERSLRFLFSGLLVVAAFLLVYKEYISIG